MNDKEKIELLKEFAIFMCGVYQANYNEYADCSMVDYRLKLKKNEQKLRADIMMKFSTVQGFKLRKFVKCLSEKEYSRKLMLNDLKKIFEVVE
jgi:hypothetical protein